MATLTPRQPPVFNLPNQLTAARFVLALVLFGLISAGLWVWCLVVFFLAALTDILDGHLARKLNLGSTLGRNLDPLVDKVLMCGAYVFLLPLGAREGWLWPWMVVVVVARELLITGLRSFLEGHGAQFGADWLGKLKMWLQCAALVAIFVVLESEARNAAECCPDLLWFFRTARDGLIYAMLAATALSGLQYLWKAASLLRVEE